MRKDWNFPCDIHTEFAPKISKNIEIYGGITKDSDGDLIFKWLIIDKISGLEFRSSMNIGWCGHKEKINLDLERLKTFFDIIANQNSEAIISSRRKMQQAVQLKVLDIKKTIGW